MNWHRLKRLGVLLVIRMLWIDRSYLLLIKRHLVFLYFYFLIVYFQSSIFFYLRYYSLIFICVGFHLLVELALHLGIFLSRISSLIVGTASYCQKHPQHILVYRVTILSSIPFLILSSFLILDLGNNGLTCSGCSSSIIKECHKDISLKLESIIFYGCDCSDWNSRVVKIDR